MSNSESSWKTAITDIHPNKILLRGYPIDELMGKITYSQAVYLALKGELPDDKVGKLLDAMLVSSIDHGVTPPSVMAALVTASTGAPLNAAIASGILSINRYHGGAIEDAMKVFYLIKEKQESTGEDVKQVVSSVLDDFRAHKRRVMGFGHRVHTSDPRTAKLFSLAEEAGVAGDFITIARAVEEKLAIQLGKKLPINVDGAIAAILCELDFPPEIANGFFIMARVPGIIAHVFEEQTRQKPMRKIQPDKWQYDGPAERHLD